MQQGRTNLFADSKYFITLYINHYQEIYEHRNSEMWEQLTKRGGKYWQVADNKELAKDFIQVFALLLNW